MNGLKLFLLIVLVAVLNGQTGGERDSFRMYQLSMISCDQSSNLHADATCHRAIDGIRSYVETSNECARVGAENGWWRGKIKIPARIKRVHLHNRRECCYQDRLNDFTISVDGNRCVEYKQGANFIDKAFDCVATGQMIQISSNRPYLTLCEVEVFGEYIDDKNYGIPMSSCKQSSAYTAVQSCKRAFDGGFMNVNLQCVHLGNENGWWSAKFGNRAHVNRVKIFNRYECCRDRLNDFDISIDGVRCHRHNSTITFREKTFACDAIGEEIKITSRLPYLTLCEVKVYGKNINGGNYHLRLVSCDQSSKYSDDNWCLKAMFEYLITSEPSAKACAHLGNEKGWWQATTLKPAHIKELLIRNRKDCCRNRLNDFEISVDGLRCAKHKSSVTFLQQNFKCNAIGQTIRISSYKIYLTLCGVNAFGEYFTEEAYSKTYLPVDPSCRSSETGGSNKLARQVLAGSNKDCRLQCTLDDNCKYYNFQDAKCTVSKNADDMQFRKSENANDLCNEACSGTRRFCIFQQRLDNSVRFNRTWTEYENGFGNSKNFWRGLKWLHAITSMSKNATFRAELTYLDGTKQVSENSGFLVEGAKTNYTMSYKSYSREVSTSHFDAMAKSNRRMFSTTDRDNDIFGTSCSNRYHGGAGWWFGQCSNANPNGIMTDNSTKLTSDEAMHWMDGSNRRAPLKSVRLLVTKPE